MKAENSLTDELRCSHCNVFNLNFNVPLLRRGDRGVEWFEWRDRLGEREGKDGVGGREWRDGGDGEEGMKGRGLRDGVVRMEGRGGKG